MDPTAALTEIRDMIADYQQGTPVSLQFVNLVDGLDRWLTKGGFLPDQWTMPDYYPLAAPIHDGVATEVTNPDDTLEEIRGNGITYQADRNRVLRLMAGLDRWILTKSTLPKQWTANRP